MKCLRLLSIINGVFLSSNVAATTLVTPVDSSYVDFSINTPWEPQTQDMEPADLVTPEQSQENDRDAGEDTIQDTSNIQQFLQEIYLEKIPSVLWQFIEMPSMIGANNANKEQFTLNNTDQLKRANPQSQLDIFAI
ncbi:hypothetical protein [Legionella maioricensis]|uniref:Uncharacterized protein n=1 Tax=Legionella maioricensis TaxID=2896528 RepID=A0A9X2IB91_9GAMM|nr:hypothetical protein [Legionella maioricensis]MCL9684724.1 hypothetical protein [Legionella maioricensis]MCL9687752.1 hypothetical protein [Legionella maioricensis]